jgi:rubrerythrin
VTAPAATPLLAGLHEARAAEREQALYYRALASLAEDRDDAALSERFNELHADEQHHLSRLSARLLELGEKLAELGTVAPPVSLDGWEQDVRARERREITRYEALLEMAPDDRTAAMLESFLEAERGHERELGGKWMGA